MAMRLDPIQSMKEELQEFVVQTQARLEGLLKSANNLKTAARKAALGSATLDGDGCLGEPNGQAKEHDACGFELRRSRLSSTPVTQSKAAEIRCTDRKDDERGVVDGSAVASDRLEALKRRLAEQIQKK